MPARKNHHYVPQFYFRRFSKDGRSICALMRESGRFVPQASIKGQASKAWFYGKGQVEDALCEIEGHCSGAIRELAGQANPANLPPEHIDLVLAHLALQRSRTQAAREAAQPLHDKLMRLFAEMSIANSTELGESEKETLLQELPNFGLDPVAPQALEMSVAMESAHAMADLRPLLLTNRTNRPFIFGDSPVIFYNAHLWNVRLRGVLGMSAPGLMVLMPLSSRCCLLLLDDLAYTVRGANSNRVPVRHLKDVEALNKLQLHAAAECVYFEDAEFRPYVEALWSDERHRLTKHAGMVVQAPGFDASTREPIGDIVHGFQPQLAYRAEFTFVSHAVLGDGDIRLLRRPTCSA